MVEACLKKEIYPHAKMNLYTFPDKTDSKLVLALQAQYQPLLVMK
jgi:hypothetical protein